MTTFYYLQLHTIRITASICIHHLTLIHIYIRLLTFVQQMTFENIMRKKKLRKVNHCRFVECRTYLSYIDVGHRFHHCIYHHINHVVCLNVSCLEIFIYSQQFNKYYFLYDNFKSEFSTIGLIIISAMSKYRHYINSQITELQLY